MRMKIILDEETEKELLYRSNFLGVSISSSILLHLILYHDKSILNRENFNVFKNGNYRYLQMDVTECVIRKYDSKPRYDNSISMLLSVYLHDIVKKTKTEWESMASKIKLKMVFSTYSIEKNTISKMRELKKKTGLTFTTIINYAATMDDVEPIDQLSLFSDDTPKKQQQGFQLTKEALKKISGQAENQQIKSVGQLLEIKLKKTLEMLDI